MKLVLTAVFFVLLVSSVYANEIDALKTFDDINRFLKAKVLPKDFETPILVQSSANTSTRFGKHSFHKLDLDADGSTDLVADGTYLVAVIDLGNGKYEITFLDRGTFALVKYTLKDIEWAGKLPVLVITAHKDENWPLTGLAVDKKIVYKFGGFMEFNPQPDKFAIRKISFATSQCFGSCPEFSLDISSDRKVVFNAKKYNKKQGVFTGTVDADTFNKLVDTINYIGLLRLKNEYSVPWTDDQGSTLTVALAKGPTVKIRDYGMIGTYGLENLYNQLTALRETVSWNKK